MGDILNQDDLDALFAQLGDGSAVDEKPSKKSKSSKGSKKSVSSAKSPSVKTLENPYEYPYQNPYEPQTVERETVGESRKIYKCDFCGRHFSAGMEAIFMQSHEDSFGNKCCGSGKKITHPVTNSSKAEDFLIPFLNGFGALWARLKQKGVA